MLNVHGLLVGVKSATGLLAELAGINFAFEQVGRTEPLAELAMQRLRGIETDVKADMVGQLEGTHRDVRPEFEPAVDVLLRGDPLVVRADSLVDPGDQDSVDDEARLVIGLPRLLAERRGDGMAEVDRVGRGLLADDHLDAGHHGDRVHEVQSGDEVGTIGRARDARDRQRTRVGGDGDVIVEERVEVGEQFPFDVESFHDRLDDEVGCAQIGQLGRGVDPVEDGIRGVLDGITIVQSRQAGSDSVGGFLELRFVEIAEGDVVPGGGRHLCDAGSHRACTHDADAVDRLQCSDHAPSVGGWKLCAFRYRLETFVGCSVVAPHMRPIDDSPIVRDGNVLILAYDHGLEHGPVDFEPVPDTADPETVFDVATHDAVTALAVQKGVAEAYYPSYKDEVELLVKLNGTSNLWMGEYDSAVNCSVDYAVELGASAVGFTLYGGSNHEVEMAEEFSMVQETARQYDLPVVMWSYPRGQGLKNDTKPDVIAYASRLALELGADVAKVKYPGSREAMEWVVDAAGNVKVIMSGGSKTDDLAFLERVESVMDAGGRGLAVGRNVWQRDDPTGMLDSLEAVIFEGQTATDALHE